MTIDLLEQQPPDSCSFPIKTTRNTAVPQFRKNVLKTPFWHLQVLRIIFFSLFIKIEVPLRIDGLRQIKIFSLLLVINR